MVHDLAALGPTLVKDITRGTVPLAQKVVPGHKEKKADTWAMA
jgi:hypothetical protein